MFHVLPPCPTYFSHSELQLGSIKPKFIWVKGEETQRLEQAESRPILRYLKRYRKVKNGAKNEKINQAQQWILKKRKEGISKWRNSGKI